MKLLRKLFGKRRVVVEMPEVAGARLGLSEIEAALSGTLKEARTRAVLQILMMRRHDYLTMSQGAAYEDANPNYYLGGVKALEDFLHDLLGVIEGTEVTGELKEFFREE